MWAGIYKFGRLFRKNFETAEVYRKYIIFPIISAYVEQVSRWFGRGRKAKLEGKLLKGGSEIDGHFVNFSNIEDIINPKKNSLRLPLIISGICYTTLLIAKLIEWFLK